MGKLFPIDLPALEWLKFNAEGFNSEVAGVIFDSSKPACCGVPLGGLGTGCIDIETTGVLGYNSAFPAQWQQPGGPNLDQRKPQHLLPFLGLGSGGKVWIMTIKKYIDGGIVDGCGNVGFAFDDVNQKMNSGSQIKIPEINGVEPVKEIHYWGHYPVADIEYEMEGPFSVGMRAWSPFIPGDYSASSIPGAVFEVHVRNKSITDQKATLAFSFPGSPEVGPGRIIRDDIHGSLEGIAVTSLDGKTGYVLGVIENEARKGLGLSSAPDLWSKISAHLPEAGIETSGSDTTIPDISSSVAVDFALKPAEEKIVRFILAWYAPEWTGKSYIDQIALFDFADLYTDEEFADNLGTDIIGNEIKLPAIVTEQIKNNKDKGVNYTAMYACRFKNAAEAAMKLAEEHEPLLKRVLSWQQEIYKSAELPAWLRDVLVNSLCLITETSYWAQPREPIGDWSFPHGAFGLVESPRSCAVMGCIASNWLGDLPLVYFFPELERMIIHNYCRYMREDGAVPFLFPDGDFTKPGYEWQLMLNSSCFTFITDRYWLCTGDNTFIKEVYPYVKRSIDLVMNLKPAPEGIVSFYREGKGQEWWEWEPLHGIMTHLGGVHLATLQIGKKMAEHMHDSEFAAKCGKWFEQGSKLLEDTMWKEDRYLWFYDTETGKSKDIVFSCMFDGEWVAKHHGLPPVFREDRFVKNLETIKKSCVCDCGLTAFGSQSEGPSLSMYGNYIPSTIIAAMTFMYGGESELGLELARRILHNLVCVQGHPWDMPNEITCETGKRRFGTDYYQNMVVWSLPTAIGQKPQDELCRMGGLVDRIIEAGKKQESEKINRMHIDQNELLYKRRLIKENSNTL